MFSEVEKQLNQANFIEISQVASYENALTYKVTKGEFIRYLYFVKNADSKTILFLSKDSPFRKIFDPG